MDPRRGQSPRQPRRPAHRQPPATVRSTAFGGTFWIGCPAGRFGSLGKFGLFSNCIPWRSVATAAFRSSRSLPFACLFRESARTCPIARRACARWRLAKVTRKPNSHLNRLEGATPASISRRPRSPSLAGGSRRACDSDIAFLGRSALLAAGRGSEAPGATSRRTAFGSEWRAISGSVVDDHRTRPRASPFAFRPARRAHRLPTPTRHGPRKACDQDVDLGVQGFGWRGKFHPPGLSFEPPVHRR